MQPGDIVESVDMEMSDDETDSKPKGRVLVDLRSQDRDMRISAPSSSSSHLDMDMRIIPLPGGPGSNSSRRSLGGQLVQDVHLMHTGPPPQLLPQFHQNQSGFRQDQSEFHHGQPVDFHTNQLNFHQNRPPPNFLPSPQDFHPHHQPQQDFHQAQQDFEYRDRQQHDGRSKQDFSAESPGRGRYSQSSVDHQHRDSSSFHRNERNSRGGRFSRNRRERYSEEHNQRNSANSRNSRSQDQQQSPEIRPNSRPLQPPDTVVILDDEGMPISMPEFDQDNVTLPESVVQSQERQEHDDNRQSSMPQTRHMSQDTPSSHDSDRSQKHQAYPSSSNLASEHEQASSSIGSNDTQQPPMNQVTVIPITTDAGDAQQNQYVPISEYEEHVESEHSGSIEKIPHDGNESVHEGGQDTSYAENEQVDEQQTDLTATGNELKRTAANGSFECEQPHEDESPNKKRTLLPNGPQTSGDCGPNGGPSPHGTPTELHPAMIHEYDGHGPSSPNFRPRIGPVPFPPWRGPLRGNRGFRGGLPRGPWLDRGPRGLAGANFPPRGLKPRGGQFRANFRGRGRGSNW